MYLSYTYLAETMTLPPRIPTLLEIVVMWGSPLLFRKTRIKLACLLLLPVIANVPCSSCGWSMWRIALRISQDIPIALPEDELWIRGVYQLGLVECAIISWLAAAAPAASPPLPVCLEGRLSAKKNEPYATVNKRGLVVRTKVCNKTWSHEKQARHTTQITSVILSFSVPSLLSLTHTP